MKIILVLFLVLYSGEPHKAEKPVDSLEECMAQGAEFAKHAPAEFGAMAMGFSCWTISPDKEA